MRWHSLPTKAHLVKAMVFFISHVWIWELDYKESWASKNWCFWTMVLEKTLESPLDYKKIQPVHPKGNQSWIFIGRIDVEAETPILWPPGGKNWLIGKDPDAGKNWRQEEKRTRGWDGCMASPTWWTWVWASSRSWWWTGKPGVLQSMGSQRVRHDWATELMRWQISLHTHAHNWTFVLTILERNPNLYTLYWISMFFGMSALMQSTTVKSTHELVC